MATVNAETTFEFDENGLCIRRNVLRRAAETCVNVIIPDKVKSISEGAFLNCKKLKTVVIPGSVQTIGKKAFEDTPVQEVTLSEGLLKINKNAFSSCKKLNSVKIPESTELIDERAFLGCTSLNELTIQGNTGIGNSAFSNCSALTDIELGKTSYIDENAFSGCEKLRSIEIPETVTEIGICAFLKCTGLVWATIGATVIKERAFALCNNLREIELTDKVRELDKYSLANLDSLEEITIPASVTRIGEYAFSKCKALQSILFLSGADIAECCFQDCTSLESLAFSDGVESIASGAFRNCVSLTEVEFPRSLTLLEEEAFEGCESLESISFRSKAIIEKDCFSNCEYLTSIDLGEQLIEIGEGAFRNLKRVDGITIPASVTRIGDYAFSKCESLIDVEIRSDADIGDNCFESCNNMETLNIEGHPKVIGESAFSDCSTLWSITIPEGVERICDHAFEYCTELRELTLNSGLKEIGERAFYSCSNLDSVEIPVGVTEINDETFSCCTQLSDISLPEGLKYIGYQAFADCYLSSIDFPDSLEGIASCAFESNFTITDVTLPAGTIYEEDAFDDTVDITGGRVGTVTSPRMKAFADRMAAEKAASGKGKTEETNKQVTTGNKKGSAVQPVNGGTYRFSDEIIFDLPENYHYLEGTDSKGKKIAMIGYNPKEQSGKTVYEKRLMVKMLETNGSEDILEFLSRQNSDAYGLVRYATDPKSIYIFVQDQSVIGGTSVSKRIHTQSIRISSSKALSLQTAGGAENEDDKENFDNRLRESSIIYDVWECIRFNGKKIFSTDDCPDMSTSMSSRPRKPDCPIDGIWLTGMLRRQTDPLGFDGINWSAGKPDKNAKSVSKPVVHAPVVTRPVSGTGKIEAYNEKFGFMLPAGYALEWDVGEDFKRRCSVTYGMFYNAKGKKDYQFHALISINPGPDDRRYGEGPLDAIRRINHDGTFATLATNPKAELMVKAVPINMLGQIAQYYTIWLMVEINTSEFFLVNFIGNWNDDHSQQIDNYRHMINVINAIRINGEPLPEVTDSPEELLRKIPPVFDSNTTTIRGNLQVNINVNGETVSRRTLYSDDNGTIHNEAYQRKIYTVDMLPPGQDDPEAMVKELNEMDPDQAEKMLNMLIALHGVNKELAGLNELLSENTEENDTPKQNSGNQIAKEPEGRKQQEKDRIQAQIKSLRNEQQEAKGLFAGMKRKKIQKEIDLLTDKMRQL